MRIDIVTLFPELCDGFLSASILGRARAKNLFEAHCHQIRDYTKNKQKQTDDYPYGGGCGMVLYAQPIADCLRAVQDQCAAQGRTKPHVVFLTAAGQQYNEETAKRLMENKFDMNDMLEQFAQIRKMGGAGAMLSMLPGASGIDASQIDEKAFDRIEAMIYSMTKEEREKPSIINPKRKRRIAAGSGTRVEDVNKLLKQYEMMQKMMKQFKKSPKGFARRLGGMMGNPNAFRGLK